MAIYIWISLEVLCQTGKQPALCLTNSLPQPLNLVQKLLDSDWPTFIVEWVVQKSDCFYVRTSESLQTGFWPLPPWYCLSLLFISGPHNTIGSPCTALLIKKLTLCYAFLASASTRFCRCGAQAGRALREEEQLRNNFILPYAEWKNNFFPFSILPLPCYDNMIYFKGNWGKNMFRFGAICGYFAMARLF